MNPHADQQLDEIASKVYELVGQYDTRLLAAVLVAVAANLYSDLLLAKIKTLENVTAELDFMRETTLRDRSGDKLPKIVYVSHGGTGTLQ